LIGGSGVVGASTAYRGISAPDPIQSAALQITSVTALILQDRRLLKGNLPTMRAALERRLLNLIARHHQGNGRGWRVVRAWPRRMRGSGTGRGKRGQRLGGGLQETTPIESWRKDSSSTTIIARDGSIDFSDSYGKQAVERS